MRKIVIPVGIALIVAACGGGASSPNKFSAHDGSVRAEMKHDRWTITDSLGREPVEDYDSMRVVEVGEDGHPMTVVYYKGSRQLQLQYYSTMRLRSEGWFDKGRREGRWVFYHPNGATQVEASYVNGKEEGNYRVYRDNGSPIYVGRYEAGKPVGQWEAYDREGQLVERIDY